MNITFIKRFFDDLKFTLIAQGWSLTVEECFYISAPLLFLGFRKSRWFLLYSSAVLIATGCLLISIFSNVNFYGFFNSYHFLFTYTFSGRCAEFLIGASIVILFHAQLKKTKQGIAFTLLGFVLTMCSIILMTLLTMTDTTSPYSLDKFATASILLPTAIALFFYGLITEASLLNRILSSTLFVALGRASYTFYLIHAGIFYSFINSYLPSDYLLTFLLLNLISLGLWWAVEEPLNNLIRRL